MWKPKMIMAIIEKQYMHIRIGKPETLFMTTMTFRHMIDEIDGFDYGNVFFINIKIWNLRARWHISKTWNDDWGFGKYQSSAGWWTNNKAKHCVFPSNKYISKALGIS